MRCVSAFREARYVYMHGSCTCMHDAVAAFDTASKVVASCSLPWNRADVHRKDEVHDAYQCSVIMSFASTIVLEMIRGVDWSETLIGVVYVSKTTLKV